MRTNLATKPPFTPGEGASTVPRTHYDDLDANEKTPTRQPDYPGISAVVFLCLKAVQARDKGGYATERLPCRYVWSAVLANGVAALQRSSAPGASGRVWVTRGRGSFIAGTRAAAFSAGPTTRCVSGARPAAGLGSGALAGSV